MAQKIKDMAVTVALFLAALIVVAASEQAPRGDEIGASCSAKCRKEHKYPTPMKQCVDFCVMSSKYQVEAYARETSPIKRVGEFKDLCFRGCSEEYEEDPKIQRKCVDYCDAQAKELTDADAFAKR